MSGRVGRGAAAGRRGSPWRGNGPGTRGHGRSAVQVRCGRGGTVRHHDAADVRRPLVHRARLGTPRPIVVPAGSVVVRRAVRVPARPVVVSRAVSVPTRPVVVSRRGPCRRTPARSSYPGRSVSRRGRSSYPGRSVSRRGRSLYAGRSASRRGRSLYAGRSRVPTRPVVVRRTVALPPRPIAGAAIAARTGSRGVDRRHAVADHRRGCRCPGAAGCCTARSCRCGAVPTHDRRPGGPGRIVARRAGSRYLRGDRRRDAADHRRDGRSSSDHHLGGGGRRNHRTPTHPDIHRTGRAGVSGRHDRWIPLIGPASRRCGAAAGHRGAIRHGRIEENPCRRLPGYSSCAIVRAHI